MINVRINFPPSITLQWRPFKLAKWQHHGRHLRVTRVGTSGVTCKCLEYYPFASLLPSHGTIHWSHTHLNNTGHSGVTYNWL